jgi:hypothetical protein
VLTWQHSLDTNNSMRSNVALSKTKSICKPPSWKPPTATHQPQPTVPSQTKLPQINAAPARGPDHFPFQGFRDSGIGSQGIRNSLAMMVKTKSTVVNLDKDSYAQG